VRAGGIVRSPRRFPSTLALGATRQQLAHIHRQHFSRWAASAQVVGSPAAREKPTSGRLHPFSVDRPFLILIRDDMNGTVLFIGQVLDPRSG
jgi:serine protease inhibitor